MDKEPADQRRTRPYLIIIAVVVAAIALLAAAYYLRFAAPQQHVNSVYSSIELPATFDHISTQWHESNDSYPCVEHRYATEESRLSVSKELVTRLREAGFTVTRQGSARIYADHNDRKVSVSVLLHPTPTEPNTPLREVWIAASYLDKAYCVGG